MKAFNAVGDIYEEASDYRRSRDPTHVRRV